jgi:hypothetical protein
MLRLSGVVSNWKNSLKDWICTSRRSGASARCLILPKSTLEFTFVEDICVIPVLQRLGHTNHPQALIFFKTKVYEFQLLAHDLGCQNIIGQNKGWQR